ncbi:alpha/beta hydrolase [Limnohabitans sp. T6-5]|uniref:YheT family hydrolase n=1 Tax=Limnohabitans sp. T6-5 TaxID=1100724 RepID=UPI000D342FC1|nr:alpha/beta fold hydrolase [Limnohabitans sp. T6-5]PUE09510.1 alpha/beta hydrolase [Limnohabitans sp. T6-5]
MQYKSPFWLPGGHAQTIWSALYAKRRWAPPVVMTRERWNTPDHDFLDVDWQHASQKNRPLFVLFHGLEGSSESHYAQAFADWAAAHDMNFALPHFRGCSGELNRAPRAYHSGDHEEINWILERMRRQHRSSGGHTLVAAGVSLGGNALMRWAGEHGQQAAQVAEAVASICSPLDLAQSGRAIGRGFNKQVYTRMFLRTMKPKALAKWMQHPGLFDRQKLMAASDLYEFDNVFTAPLHGFLNTDDYWQRASAKPLMKHIRIPALVLNAQNDPFVPAASLPKAADVSDAVTLWQPMQGGHVGFAQGNWPSHVRGLPDAVGAWLLGIAGLKHQQEGLFHG